MAIKFYGGHQLNSKTKVYGTRQDFEVIEVDGTPTESLEMAFLFNLVGTSKNGMGFDGDVGDFGSDNFMIDFWAYQNSNGSSGEHKVLSMKNSYINPSQGGAHWSIERKNGEMQFVYYNSSGSTTQVSWPYPQNNRWNHFSVIRSGDVLTLTKYTVEDGESSVTHTLPSDFEFNPVMWSHLSGLALGGGYSKYSGNWVPSSSFGGFSGWLADVRIVKGNSVPYSAPIGAAEAITGTSLLTLQNSTDSVVGPTPTTLGQEGLPESNTTNIPDLGPGPRYYKTLATQYVPPPIPPASFFMVAGPYSDIQATNAGRVYIFDSITENGQTPDSYIEAPLGAGSYFGSQIVQNSTQIAIGAYGEEGLEGSAYLYDKSDLTATPIRLHPAAAQPMDFTSSYALSMSDNHLVMGAFGDDDVGSTSGSAYVYDLSTNQVIKKLLPPGGGANTRFGSNAAVSDTHVAVTSGGNDGGAFQQSIFLWELSNLNATPTHIHPTSYSSIVEGGFGGGQGLTLHIHDNKLFASNRSTSSSDNWAGEVYMFDMNDLSAEPTIFEIPLVRIGQSIRVENDKLYVSALGTGIYIWDLNDTSADPVFLEKPAGTSGDFAGYISVAGSSLITGDENHLSNQGAAFLYDLNDLSADPIMVTSGSGQEEYLGKALLAVE